MHNDDPFEDDYVPDDLVAVSGDEFDDETGEQNTLATDTEETGSSPQEDPTASAKKRKRREKEKQKKTKKRKLIETTDLVRPISAAAAPPVELADYLAARQLKTFSKYSQIELLDMQIPDTAIADTTAWTDDRTLDRLVDFITKMLPTLRTRLGQKPKNNGAPTLLVVSPAALRVTDMTRILKIKTLRGDKGGDVAKLFARHFKLEEHVTYLRRTKLSAAVGTPGRIGKLLTETDALSVSALSHVILDVTFQDAKKRSLLDIPETRDEVFKTILGAPKLLNVIKQGKVQIVLF